MNTKEHISRDHNRPYFNNIVADIEWMVSELSEGKSKNKTAWGWQREWRSQQDMIQFENNSGKAQDTGITSSL